MNANPDAAARGDNMLKVMTVLGTRPEIIRLSMVIEQLDRLCNHVIVHTGQNYEDCLSAMFLRELHIRAPDVYLGIRGSSFGEQVGQLFARIEPLFREHKPDRLLVLGDTNSGLIAVVAKRLGIPVFHMEAGNRCYDNRVPEEVNRRVIDHSSSVLMPYTERSRQNLVREGIPSDRVFVTGNPIKEVMDHCAERVRQSEILARLSLEEKRFFLVTLHRAENVDDESRLRQLVDALVAIHDHHRIPVICSFHPRTRSRVETFGINIEHDGLRFLEPFSFSDFLRMERDAYCILSDSGTVQEEACILGVPNVTIRETTERPETVECGSNILSGCSTSAVLDTVNVVLSQKTSWVPPAEYLAPHVAATVVRIVLGYRIPDLAEQRWHVAIHAT